MTKITDYIKPYYLRMTAGFGVKFLATIMDLLIPWILAHLIDNIVPQESISLIAIWGVMMFVCSGLSLVFNISANRMAARVSADTTKKIRHDLFEKIIYLSCKNIDDYTLPSVVSRLTSDTYNIHQMLGMIQRMGVRAPILLIGGIIITLSLDFYLALVLITMLPFITIIVYLISRKGIPLYKSLQKTVDRMIRIVRENITGVRVIKALSKSEYEKEKFNKINEEVISEEKKAAITMASTNPLMHLLLNTGLILVIIVGAYRVNSDLTQPGKIIAFLSYFAIILNAMLAITRIFVIISRGTASFQRVADVLDVKDDLAVINEDEDEVESDSHVSFENVSFSYNKVQNDLHDINFNLKKGSTLGIIGASGSGKSSIIKLLMRFYDADNGVIRIGGKNIKSIPFEELHNKFGIVFQNDILFADTISENISFGRELENNDIILSAKYAQAQEFIEDLDERYDHKLTIRGANLSGGQKQRLLISRALAGNPEILVLDDSSSALDYNTDAMLRKTIRKKYENTTTIIVAQRISSVRYAENIIVMDDGKIICQGKHDELLESCPVYAEINKIQSGGMVL